MRRTALTLAAALAASSAMAANVVPQTGMQQTYGAWTPTGFAVLNAGTTSGSVALGSTGAANQAFVAWVQNVGSQGAWVQLGTDATVTASTTSGLYVPPGACAPMNAVSGSYPATYIAAVTASGTTQINVNTGYGSAAGACPQAVASGGASGGTVAQGAAGTQPWPVTTPDARGTGTIASATVGANYAVATNDQGTARFVVAGLTASGATLQAQYSADGGTTWEPIAILRPPLPYSTTITADGQYEVKASAATNLRLIVTVAGTGTVNVASDVTEAQGLVGLVGPVPPRANTIGGIGATTTGGATPLSRLVSSAATTNATGGGALAGPHRVFRIFGCNTTTAAVYLKMYNVAAVPTPGTTPVYDSRPLPAAASAGGLSCQSFDISDVGIGFSTGVAYALTTGNADSDATAPAAGAVTQLVFEGI